MANSEWPARGSSNPYLSKPITGTANEITVTNGDGVSGDPTISLPATIDLSGKTLLKIPTNAAPSVAANGALAVDTTVTDLSHSLLKYYGGEELGVVAMPIAQYTGLTSGAVPTYNSTADEFQMVVPSSGTSVKDIATFKPNDNEPPASNFATLNVRNSRTCLEFDDTTQEAAIFFGRVPRSYAGGNLIVELLWAAASATSGTIGWDATFENIVAGTLDLDGDDFATAQTITAATVSGTSGIPSRTSVTIAAGAAGTDALAAGDFFRLRVRRDVANDTATGDAQLFGVEIREV